MRDSRLGLLLATSFSLLQYNCTPGLCQTHQVDAAARQRYASSSSNFVTSEPMTGEHVLLFFTNKDQNDKSSVSRAPAAALTIHPVLPLSLAVAKAPSPAASKPTLVAMNGDLEGSLFEAASNAQASTPIHGETIPVSNVTAAPASPALSVTQISSAPPVASTGPQAPPSVTSITKDPASFNKLNDEEQSLEPAATVSDSLTAEPPAPEPLPIAGMPHTASSENQSQGAPSQTPSSLGNISAAAAPIPQPIAQQQPADVAAAPIPQPIAQQQPADVAAAPNPQPIAQQQPADVAAAPNPQPIAQQQPADVAAAPNPQPIAQQQPADVAAAPRLSQKTSQPPLSLTPQVLQPLTSKPAETRLKAQMPRSQSLTPEVDKAHTPVAVSSKPAQPAELVDNRSIADNEPTIESVSKSDARPPSPIFINTNSDSNMPAAVPIASLPPIKSRHDNRAPKQPSPEQLIAQASPSTAASPIPPVVSGTIDLEEFKSSNVIDLKVSQSRTFRLRNRIIRTSISDPSIAEPVVVTENQMVLLGKSPGGATLVVWDDAGNSLAVDVHVERDFSELQATLREIDPRIIVKPFSVGGSDRVILLGDVDHAESVIRAFSAANAFMDDRGMKIMAANSRLINEKIGEMPVNMSIAMSGMGGGSGGGALGTLSQVNNFMYFSNMSNNVSKAQAIISDGGRVTSLIRVRKTPLIVLHCQFLEMNSAAVRELGIQMGMNLSTQNMSFGIGGQTGLQSGASGIGNIVSTPGINGLFPSNFNSYSGQSPQFIGTTGLVVGTTAPYLPGGNNGLYGGLTSQNGGLGASTGPANFGVLSSLPTVFNGQLVNMPISQVGLGILNGPASLLSQSNLFGLPGGATFNSSGLANLFSGVSNLVSTSHYRFSLNPTINGIISHSRARVLAEPTLVTMSGERAAFLAGGEIPIEQSIATAGTAQMSVVFEPFGLRLNMIPVLLENGVINLEVSPEERLLSQANAINLINIGTIPGFTTRKLQTIVELKPGQELFISGLVSANSGRELDKTPILGEIPVLGALYRSKAFAKNESELVVSVRPEIIVPGNPGQLKLPEEVSRVESTRDTNIFQVEPTVVDERYMTSGNAEHPQRIPGTLPAGAAIPDNE